jgi:hypothetical protein
MIFRHQFLCSFIDLLLVSVCVCVTCDALCGRTSVRDISVIIGSLFYSNESLLTGSKNSLFWTLLFQKLDRKTNYDS